MSTIIEKIKKYYWQKKKRKPMSFIIDLDKLMLEFTWKNKTCKSSKENTEKQKF